MPYTHKILSSTSATSSATTFQAYVTLLTVGAGKSVIINRMILNNAVQATVDIEYRIRAVPSGVTASDNHIVANGEGTADRINAGKTLTIAATPFVLGPGDTLSIALKGSTATSATVGVTIFGVEIS